MNTIPPRLNLFLVVLVQCEGLILRAGYLGGTALPFLKLNQHLFGLLIDSDVCFGL